MYETRELINKIEWYLFYIYFLPIMAIIFVYSVSTNIDFPVANMLMITAFIPITLVVSTLITIISLMTGNFSMDLGFGLVVYGAIYNIGLLILFLIFRNNRIKYKTINTYAFYRCFKIIAWINLIVIILVGILWSLFPNLTFIKILTYI